MSDKKNCNELLCNRKNSVGGQAVLEGIMMKSKDKYSIAVRKDDGSISVSDHEFRSVRKRLKFLNIPILRGAVNFIETMMLSYKTLAISADALGIAEEEESKFEKWLKKKFGKSIVDFVMVISGVLGVALALGLFVFLPILATRGIEYLAGGELGLFKNLIEGCIKILIFILYIWGVSFMKDIRRTFEYHGAEHKSIFCYESGDELTVENVKKYKRFHPRCGTSFIFVVLIISILVYSLPFVTWDNMLLRSLTKILLLPIVVGTSYEFIMWAGKHDNNIIAKILSAPGLFMQRITTKEPDDGQIEVAIVALKRSLPEVFGNESEAEAEVVLTKEENGDGTDK
ncbi:MAG: DUF1385 domain-containing protein [Ruminococcaceae bacterium]|nr:DUF1385 domain-containing protein [Oscillospiraceae bacterium]